MHLRLSSFFQCVSPLSPFLSSPLLAVRASRSYPRQFPTITSTSVQADMIVTMSRFWELVLLSGIHANLLSSVPPNVLSLFVRCTSSYVHPKCCLTLWLHFLCACPSAVSLSCSRLPQGWLVDSSALPLVTANMRCVFFAYEGTVLPDLLSRSFRLFSFYLRQQRSHVVCFFRDLPQCAQVLPVQYSALRAGLRAQGYRKVLVPLDPIPQPTPCNAEEPALDFCQATIDMLTSTFTDPGAAAEWLDASSSIRLQQEHARGQRPRAQRRSEFVRLLSALVRLLPTTLSRGVQRVLSTTKLEPASAFLDVAGFFIYALVSPLWSRVYVGATGRQHARQPLERWLEHVRCARLWNSRTSCSRFVHNVPPLYKAMAAVGVQNVALIPICQVLDSQHLLSVERHLIRLPAPTFNVQGTLLERGPLPSHILSCWWSEDLISVASRVLRQVHPRLSPPQWVSLITAVRASGDRVVAARLARHARRVCPSLHTVRSSPRVIFPCPITPSVRQAFQRVVRRALRVLPSPCRLDNFEVGARCLSACWRGSPYLTDILSPSISPLECVGPCFCMHISTGVHHIFTREWQHLSCCYAHAKERRHREIENAVSGIVPATAPTFQKPHSGKPHHMNRN